MKRFFFGAFVFLLQHVSVAHTADFESELIGFSVSAMESSNSNYEHDTISVRAHISSASWNVKGWDLRWSIEPNINWFEHELNDPTYVKEDETGYLELRERYTNGIDFMFIGVEGAIVAQKKLSHRSYFEVSAGIGVGYLEDETERQAKGFTFSETGRVGFSLNTDSGEFFLGYAIVHVSNAGLDNPNGGYDLSGISLKYQKKFRSLP